MTILPAEIKWYYPKTISSDASNGGKLSTNLIPANTKNSVFPDVDRPDADAGITAMRKLFVQIENDDDIGMNDSKIILSQFSTGDDYIEIFPGTPTNTEGDLTGSERRYGSASLRDPIVAGDTQFVVTLEHSDQVIFANADMIFLTDGNRVELRDNVTISKNLSEVTITCDTNDAISFNWAAGTVVGSVIQVGVIEAGYDSVSISVAGDGTFTATGNIDLDNIGTIDANWTITRDTGNTTWTAVCDDPDVSDIQGNVGEDFAPPNPNKNNKPFFIVRNAGYNFTWTDGDYLQFNTTSATSSIWAEHIVPAGTPSQVVIEFELSLKGDPQA